MDDFDKDARLLQAYTEAVAIMDVRTRGWGGLLVMVIRLVPNLL